MTFRPLVSVMTPARDAAATLPLALASLAAQTMEDWEAVVVDDGSVDGTAEIAAAWGDPRVRVVRLERNRGRGFARQVALDETRGAYVCMLDADDWYYPDKLARQTAFMRERPRLALVSAAMTLADADGRILGLRARLEAPRESPPLRRLAATPPAPHAPSLLRADVAKRYRYAANLRRSEDMLFMAQILLDHPHARLPEPLYVYTEAASFAREGLLARYRHNLRAHWELRRSFPVQTALNLARQAAKAALRLALAPFGTAGQPAGGTPAAPEDQARHDAARTEVLAALAAQVLSWEDRP